MIKVGSQSPGIRHTRLGCGRRVQTDGIGGYGATAGHRSARPGAVTNPLGPEFVMPGPVQVDSATHFTFRCSRLILPTMRAESIVSE